MDYKDPKVVKKLVYPDWPLPQGLHKYVGHASVIAGVYGIAVLKSVSMVMHNTIKGIPDHRTYDPDGERNGLPVLFNTKEGLYIRYGYGLFEDTFNRPIASSAGRHVDCVLRTFDPSYQGNMPPLVLTDRTRRCLNLGSYNYLGFGGVCTFAKAIERALRELPLIGLSPTAELGSLAVHRELELEIARWLGKEEVLLTGMGFATNSTVIPALVGPGDLIVSDALNHTSIVQGARESGAKVKPFTHNDPVRLERILQAAVTGPASYGKILVVVEGIYSMEGDLVKLREIVTVCKRYGAYVYLDEAHSIGAVGPTGRGVTDELGIDRKDIHVMMGTFSKSFGAAGGYIAASRDVIARIRRCAAGCTSATAMPPAVAQQVSESLRIISGRDGTDAGKRRLKAIRENANYFRDELRKMGFIVLGQEPSPVVPMMLYNPGHIGRFSRLAFERGLAVVTVGAPAVPYHRGRVRFCISASHTRQDLKEALEAISEIGDELKIKFLTKHKPSGLMPESVCVLDEERRVERRRGPLETEAEAERPAALAALGDRKRAWDPLVRPTDDDAPFRDPKPFDKESDASVAALSLCDYLGMATDDSVRSACLGVVRAKGVGSCGPRGFYGTCTEHLRAEKDLAAFLMTDHCVLYPFGACTVSSVIACTVSRGDIIVADEAVGRNIITGMNLSRAQVRLYRHCDAADAERVLRACDEENMRRELTGKPALRKFLISEAVFEGTGRLAPLPELTRLRLQYRCRFILDESHSFGVLGATGRGATEHFRLKPSAVDVICGSLECAGASCCGFAAGAKGVIAYQRLLGSGYVFSASCPPYLAQAVSTSLKTMQIEPRLARLRDRVRSLRAALAGIRGLEVGGDQESPVVPIYLARDYRTGDEDADARRLADICRGARKCGVALSVFHRSPIDKIPRRAAIRVHASANLQVRAIQMAVDIINKEVQRVVFSEQKVDEKKHARKKMGSWPHCKKPTETWVPSKPAQDGVGPPDPYSPIKPTPALARQTEPQPLSTPLLIFLNLFLSTYRSFLARQSVLTDRFSEGLLRPLGLTRKPNTVFGEWMHTLFLVLSSHMFLSLLIPGLYFAWGGSHAIGLLYITFCATTAVGSALKCLMYTTEGLAGAPYTQRAFTWPSLSALNAFLPYLFVRLGAIDDFYGRYPREADLGGVVPLLLCALWMGAVLMGRLQRGDSPSNLVGGLVSGAISVQVVLLSRERTRLGWFDANSDSWARLMSPPVIYGLFILFFVPVPVNTRFSGLARMLYGKAACAVLNMLGFLVGVLAVTSNAEPTPPAPTPTPGPHISLTTMLLRAVAGNSFLLIGQWLVYTLSRKALVGLALATSCGTGGAPGAGVRVRLLKRALDVTVAAAVSFISGLAIPLVLPLLVRVAG